MEASVKYDDDEKVYLFEAEAMRKLERIKARLYDDKMLSGDRRRDLANALDAIMSSVLELTKSSVEGM